MKLPENTQTANLHVCTAHQQYQGTFLLFQTDAHNYKIIGILKQLTLNLLTTTIVAPPSNASKWQMGFNSAFKGLKSRLSLRHVSVHIGTIIRELFRAWLKLQI